MKILFTLIITLANLLWLSAAHAQAISVCRLKNGTESKFDPAYYFCDNDLGIVTNTLKICEFGNGKKLTYLPQYDGCDPEFGIERQYHKFCKIADGRGIPYDTRSYKCVGNYGTIPITYQLCDRGTVYPFNPAVEKCEGRQIQVADAEKDPKEKRCGNYDKSVNDCHPEYGVYPKGYQFCPTQYGSIPYNPASRKCSEGFIMNRDQSLCKSADGKNLNYYNQSSESCCDGEVKAGLDSCFAKPGPDKAYCPRGETSGKIFTPKNLLLKGVEIGGEEIGKELGAKALEKTGTLGRIFGKTLTANMTGYFENIYESLEKQIAVIDILGSGRKNMITAVESIRGTYHSYSLQTLNSSTASLLFSRAVPEYSAMIASGNLCVAPSTTNSHQFEFHFYNVNQQQCEHMARFLSGLDQRLIINNKYGTSQACVEDTVIISGKDIPRNYLNFIFLK